MLIHNVRLKFILKSSLILRLANTGWTCPILKLTTLRRILTMFARWLMKVKITVVTSDLIIGPGLPQPSAFANTDGISWPPNNHIILLYLLQQLLIISKLTPSLNVQTANLRSVFWVPKNGSSWNRGAHEMLPLPTPSLCPLIFPVPRRNYTSLPLPSYHTTVHSLC